MKPNITSIISLSIPLLLSLAASGAELGTRQRTIRPVALSLETPLIYPDAPSATGYGTQLARTDPKSN
jgi:hypothetical protein